MYRWMGLDASSASKNSSCDTMLAESASRICRAIQKRMKILFSPQWYERSPTGP